MQQANCQFGSCWQQPRMRLASIKNKATAVKYYNPKYNQKILYCQRSESQDLSLHQINFMPKNTGPLFKFTTGKYKQVTWQLPTDTDSSRTLVLFISFYSNTNQWPANNMAQVPLVNTTKQPEDNDAETGSSSEGPSWRVQCTHSRTKQQSQA